jgi:hypothetical protein
VYRASGLFYSLQPVMFGFMALLLLAVALTPPHRSVAVYVLGFASGAWCAFVAWRSRRFGQVEASARGVEICDLIRRRSWGWSQVDHFGVETARQPFTGKPVRVLVVHDRTGRRTIAKSAGGRVRPDGAMSWVDVAAGELNDRLRGGHSGSDVPT